jgi:hypothetical protein
MRNAINYVVLEDKKLVRLNGRRTAPWFDSMDINASVKIDFTGPPLLSRSGDYSFSVKSAIGPSCSPEGNLGIRAWLVQAMSPFISAQAMSPSRGKGPDALPFSFSFAIIRNDEKFGISAEDDNSPVGERIGLGGFMGRFIAGHR